MKESPIFLRTTKKLYEEVNAKKERDGLHGFPRPTDLDIKLQRDFFQEDEWNFLKSNVENFKFAVQINGMEYKWFYVYQIESDSLLTNELNIWGIRSKYCE